MKIFIHVGMTKTGTSFLQAQIFPKIENVNLHHTKEMTIKILPDKLNIISHEHFSQGSYQKSIQFEDRKIVAERLKKCFPDAEIIICIREINS